MTVTLPALILAMGTPPGGGAQSPAGAFGMFVPMIIIFGIFYFMLIRPQQRKEKERRQMIDAVKSGDRIVFSGGILGTVTNVKDNVLVVKIADNVKIEVARGAVSQVLEKGDKAVADESSK
jgi:preprotein translocase subunit YajC